MLASTTTLDGSLFGADRAKIMLHSVSNISYASNSIINALSIQDWLYEDSDSTQHILEVTNNSPYTLNIMIRYDLVRQCFKQQVKVFRVFQLDSKEAHMHDIRMNCFPSSFSEYLVFKNLIPVPKTLLGSY